MALIDKAVDLLERVRQAQSRNRDASHTVRPDGSSVGFHPPKQPRRYGQQPQGGQPMEGQPPMAWGTPGYPPANPQFTGQQEVVTGWQQPVQPVQEIPQAWQQPVQEMSQTWQQPVQEMPQMWQQPVQSVQGGWTSAAAQPVQAMPPVQEIPQPVQEAPQSNISYMPHVVMGSNGVGCKAMIRMMTVYDMASAHSVIACMRNEEAVVLNLEQMTDDVTMERCLDLLYGAGCALKCTLTRISERSLYLFTPESIDLETDHSSRARSNREIGQRWPGTYQQEQVTSTMNSAQYAVGGQQAWSADYARGEAGGFERRVANRAPEQPLYTDFGRFPRY